MKSSLARVLPVCLLSACLGGAGTALGGGPIGLPPDPRTAELLVEADSTRGLGFFLVANRRDLVEETRVQLNAAARGFDRLVGERPPMASVRLTSTREDVLVTVRLPNREATSFTLPFAVGGRTGPRGSETPRVARAVVDAVAREWLGRFLATMAPASGSPPAPAWIGEARIPLWLRTGMLESVAEYGVHEIWLMHLGRGRDTLPPAPALLGPEGCDAACQARVSAPPGAAENQWVIGPPPGRLPPVRLEGATRFLAASYALTQFMLAREGSDFIRELVAASLAGRELTTVYARATSFSAEIADIDRQWRVWLASHEHGD